MKKLLSYSIIIFAGLLISINTVNANDLNYYYKQAISHYENKEFDSAISSLDKALELRKDISQLYALKGYLLYVTEKYSEAETEFIKAHELNPEDIDVVLNLARTYLQLEQLDKSITYYEKADRLKKLEPSDLYNVGVIYTKKEDYTNAFKYISLAVSKKPELDRENHLYAKLNSQDEKARLKEYVLSLKPNTKAPEKLYKLVKCRKENVHLLPVAYEVLDFIWGDPEGQILANLIMKKKIKINIKNSPKKDTNAETQQINYSYNIGRSSFPPLKVQGDTVVNISNEFLQEYNSGDVDKKLWAVIVMIHEFAHAVSTVPDNKVYEHNSKQEELIANMLGRNIAHRIFLNRELTKQEAAYYGKLDYKAIMSDDHSKLPDFNAFDEFVKKLGIKLPHYITYSDVLYSNTYNFQGKASGQSPQMEYDKQDGGFVINY